MCKYCKCGKIHKSSVRSVIVENGAIQKLPETIKEFNSRKVFVVSDQNTYKAAGNAVCSLLKKNDISFSEYTIASVQPEPDENSVGSVIMHYDKECDLIIGVGSGVVNDICKIIASVTKNPYIIVATAPSMDGYASATSSVSKDGLKVSLPSKCPDVIIGDIDILKNAPLRLLRAGLGDMLAKYISICEWRISNLITGEYYCEYVAALVRDALKKCTENADRLLKRDENAVRAVFDGLVLCGMAMEYAGLSRPASGIEHYISHIWDMRNLAFKTKADLHGIQCAIGTLIASRLYDRIKHIKPNIDKALLHAENFDLQKWNQTLLEFIGPGANAMIEAENRDQKYNIEKHKQRIENIIKNWDAVLDIIEDEIPTPFKTERILDAVGVPKTCGEIGIDSKILPMTFKATKDIRDKYVLSRLCWDLGIIDEITDIL